MKKTTVSEPQKLHPASLYVPKWGCAYWIAQQPRTAGVVAVGLTVASTTVDEDLRMFLKDSGGHLAKAVLKELPLVTILFCH